MLFKTMFLTTAMLVTPAALAQDAQPATAPATQQAPTATTTPAPAATPTASATASAVTDTEVNQFAAAALAAAKVREDTTIPEADKNARLVATVTGSGLSAERFNAISQAMQADPALNQRIQAAAAKQQPAAPAQ
ncbi:DUF4168 domain-containing protein [Sphingomonas sp. M1-B02]|uniref:DUF4168 domain-containing protein n=1 Tax=Sphingomonas sp. M1-B02 TaxID=3114300 RepID=UPI00223EF124|nr:DUF4168 domain-containing protein [Sphingomonas sp. S6-11]UZK65623.1 DUF4168 domain-containing protein [Sphingomonas sp. S6-11]